MKLKMHVQILYYLLKCSLTDPMTDHAIWWDEDTGKVWVTNGRTWTWAEWWEWLTKGGK